MDKNNLPELEIVYVSIDQLQSSEYNPRKWPKEKYAELKKSIEKFGFADPLLANKAKERKNILIGGHFRLKIAKDLGMQKVPVVYIDIPELEKEKELNLRLNKNLGEWDWELLAKFDEKLLADVGFASEDLDQIFDEVDSEPEKFDINKELKKLKIDKIEIQKGDIYQLGEHRLMCGDSTAEEDMLKLFNGEKANMCCTDPPYILDYLNGKRKGKPTDGFGYKKDRKYIGTDELPPDFTEKWMANINKIQYQDFNILIYENWKNIRTIWNEMEKYWKVKNMIVWHLPNRVQGFAAKNKFFNRHDIAMVGTTADKVDLNLEDEEGILQNDYKTALFAISGNPHWEKYGKGNKYCPTDHIEFKADDAKHSGQGIIFGTKPIEILIPYIKILTKRGDLIVEPFGGSGSTLIAAHKMARRCYIMEKCPIYAEVIKKRWENVSGQKAKKLTPKK